MIDGRTGLVPAGYFRRLDRVPDTLRRRRVLDVVREMRTGEQWRNPRHRLVQGSKPFAGPRIARFSHQPRADDAGHLAFEAGDAVLRGDRDSAGRQDGLLHAQVGGVDGAAPPSRARRAQRLNGGAAGRPGPL